MTWRRTTRCAQRFRRAACKLDQTPPGLPRVTLRQGVLPPIDVATRTVLTHDNVEVAVPADVVWRAAGFDRQEVGLEDVAFPADRAPSTSNQRRRFLPRVDHEIVQASRSASESSDAVC
jgi:hypothetical protein